MPRYAYFDLLPPQAAMRDDVLAGLRAHPKRIAPKYFYDAHGCALFEAICGLPEYYRSRKSITP